MVLNALFVFVVLAIVDLFFADMRLRALLITDVVIPMLLLGIVLFNSYFTRCTARPQLSRVDWSGGHGGQQRRVAGQPPVPAALCRYPAIRVVGRALLAPRARPAHRQTSGRVHRPGSAHALRVPAPPGVRRRRRRRGRLRDERAGRTRQLRSGRQPRRRPRARSDGKRDSYRTRPLQRYETTIPAPQLQARIDELTGAETRSLGGFIPGSAAGKHIIVIQVEALQTTAIGRRWMASVTPNQLAHQGSWYFPSHVSAAGLGTTSDVEFVANTSLYPPQDAAASLA